MVWVSALFIWRGTATPSPAPFREGLHNGDLIRKSLNYFEQINLVKLKKYTNLGLFTKV
jgi:hypothetical protein